VSISKGERDELRRIVRGDFKALIEEIDVRRAEMMAEIEKRVAARFQAHEGKIAETEALIDTIVSTANDEIVLVLRSCQEACDGYAVQAEKLHRPRVYFVREKRDEMRRAMIADLDARFAQAKARMHRQEIDLLKKLSVGALASDEAHTFLSEIPKASELVSDARLAELEAQFDTDITT
jgi:hypothetical protein